MSIAYTETIIVIVKIAMNYTQSLETSDLLN